MAGLVPAIPAFSPVRGVWSEDVGDRDKPGHGEGKLAHDCDTSCRLHTKFSWTALRFRGNGDKAQ
jgi:hypothetical protein